MLLRRATLLPVRGLVAIAVLVAACLPASARAALSWSAPDKTQTLPTGASPSDPHVATDSAGDAIAVWLELDTSNGHNRVAAALRPAGGNFTRVPGYLSPDIQAGNDVSSPAVAMNSKGDAVVAWVGTGLGAGNQAVNIDYSVRPAGGTFSTPDVPSFALSNRSTPAAAIDDAGEVMLAWTEGAAPNSQVCAQFRIAGASSNFGPEQCPSPTNQAWGALPTLAMDGAGDAVLAWDLARYTDPSNPVGTAQAYAQGAFRPSGGNPVDKTAPDFQSANTLSSGVGLFPTLWQLTTAIDAHGNSLVGIFSSAYNHVYEADHPSSQATFSSTADIGPGERGTFAFDPSGGAWALFSNGSQVQAAYRAGPAGAAWGSATTITSSTLNFTQPQVGVDGQGRPAGVWATTDYNGHNNVYASSRDAGAGAWAAPSDLSGPVDLNDTSPVFSVSGSGQAVALWEQLEGTDTVLKVSYGTPAGQKPPPPPPPPPPPIPYAIDLAAPYHPGGPLILTGKVKGDATEFFWSSDDGGGTGKVVDGKLQDSIRLRPRTRHLVVNLTAHGPGGNRYYTRAFTLPHFPRETTDQAIVGFELRNSPPVSAVGTAPALLGEGHAARDSAHAADAGCAPISVYSGAQKIEGCMRPANALNAIPDRERGVINAVADKLNLDPNNLPLMQTAISEMDGYVSEGKTMLDDTWPVVPQGAADVMSFPQARALTSSSASLDIAGQRFGASPNGFSMDLDPKRADIPLGELPRPPKFPSIGGFEVVGDWNVDLKKQEATITASLKLPNWITTAGINVQNSVTFKATPDRLILQDVKVGPMSVDIGGSLGVQDFKLTYNEPQDEWTGQGKSCFIADACLDLVPPNGEIKIKHSQLEFAGASVDFPPPGVPLFPGVNLERLGFGIGLDPTRITGNGRISVLRLVKLDGRMVMAFPSDRTPFFLKPDEVGGGFPPKLYGTEFTRVTIGATAAVIVAIPVIGQIELGHGYFLYQFPSYVALGGGVDVKLFDFLRVYGDLAGEANFSDKTINLHGDIFGCLEIDGEQCGGAVANISRAPNDVGGAGACIEIGGVHIGGGVQWARPTEPFIWPFDGCKWSRFAVDVNTSSAEARAHGGAAARTRATIRVVRGKPSPALELYGNGAAPLVRVTGPGGQQLDATKGLNISPGGKIRVIRYHGKAVSFTVVGLQNEKPGTYTVTALPGSVPFAKAARATDQPDANVSGTVTGSGAVRYLNYYVRPRAGQSVIFYDVGEGGSSKGIGHIKGGGRGRIRFLPAPGRGRRHIVAQFTLEGLGAERRTVTSFRPPSPTLAQPHGLRILRRGGTLSISWRSVPGASRYEVAVTSRSGFQRVFKTRANSLLVRRLPGWIGGVVSVRAIDATRQSLTTAAPFKSIAAVPRKIHSLGHCKVVKRKIACSGYPIKKKKPPRRRHAVEAADGSRLASIVGMARR